ncbi:MULTISPECIES: tRNA preQ1(34) S-adenosylmethionine ribosyltransferase-isomerase QueA [unclassified Moraxella]|uniref:tRNA preQ1(34) S-adenosylmethionine ribosyltransferase-isomerase QueA n=1 Tax=unclassified Moraxella TaxID=2685852 RepID=UPI003AF98A95
MKLSDFDYHLPENLIARYPLAERSASRLLYVAKGGQISDKLFTDLPNLLNRGDLIVFNDTKVMKARLFGQKQSGGAVEILVERILPDDPTTQQTNTALCHVRASRSPKVGQTLSVGDGSITITMLGREENLFVLQFDRAILPILEQYGELPIPPYFERHADDNDENRYQTVFHDPAKLASVAAPTASLHFDENILAQLNAKGVNTAFVTLHVGAGTFAPVKTDDILSHKMHSEYAELPQATADLINQTKANGGKVIAVGTTVTRVLETAYLAVKSGDQSQLGAWQGDTDIFIYPSFQFGVIDRLITNFHLPKSTLLMLVSAFAGTDAIKQAYQHAIEQQYRFFSYGDAMLLDTW